MVAIPVGIEKEIEKDIENLSKADIENAIEHLDKSNKRSESVPYFIMHKGKPYSYKEVFLKATRSPRKRESLSESDESDEYIAPLRYSILRKFDSLNFPVVDYKLRRVNISELKITAAEILRNYLETKFKVKGIKIDSRPGSPLVLQSGSKLHVYKVAPRLEDIPNALYTLPLKVYDSIQKEDNYFLVNVFGTPETSFVFTNKEVKAFTKDIKPYSISRKGRAPTEEWKYEIHESMEGGKLDYFLVFRPGVTTKEKFSKNITGWSLNGWNKVNDFCYSIQKLTKDTSKSQSEIDEWETMLKQNKQIIFYGPPGTGKTYISRKFSQYIIDRDGGEHYIIQFHPSYSYEDFVEGIKPEPMGSNIRYKTKDSIFKEFCEKAAGNKDKQYILIIDEINRGNLAKIFGELLYALEYRDDSQPIMLPYSGSLFQIPENLWIIGTMNNADKSIGSIDNALRRRFRFIELCPDSNILSIYLSNNNCLVDKQKIIDKFEKINKAIERKLGKQSRFGHSYFMRSNMTYTELDRIMKSDIKPVLEDYFFEDPQIVEELTNLSEFSNDIDQSLDRSQ